MPKQSGASGLALERDVSKRLERRCFEPVKPTKHTAEYGSDVLAARNGAPCSDFEILEGLGG